MYEVEVGSRPITATGKNTQKKMSEMGAPHVCKATHKKQSAMIKGWT